MAKNVFFFSRGTTRKIPKGYDGPILSAPVANQNEGFALSCQLADSAINNKQLLFIQNISPILIG